MRAWGGRTARVLLLGKELLVRGLHHAARPHDRRGQDGLARLQVCDLAREPLVLLDNCEGGGARGERAFGGSASMGACAGTSCQRATGRGPTRSTRGKRRAPSVLFIALCRLLISLFRLCSLRCGQRRMPCRLQTFLSTVVQTPSVAAGRAEGGVGPGGGASDCSGFRWHGFRW